MARRRPVSDPNADRARAAAAVGAALAGTGIALGVLDAPEAGVALLAVGTGALGWAVHRLGRLGPARHVR